MRRLIVLVVFLIAPHAFAYVVNNTGDAVDSNPGDNVCATSGSVCTLRAAIMEANATAGTQAITFGTSGTIAVSSAYPSITGPVTIDGGVLAYAPAPNVVIDGSNAVNIGFEFTSGAAGSSLDGLDVRRFTEAGVVVSADNVTIRRNHLHANHDGVQLAGSGSTIGGTSWFDGNVISGNTRYGILAGGSGHTIATNRIGTNTAGVAASGNGGTGIGLLGTTGAIVHDNLIAANQGHGLELAGGTTGSLVYRNQIGMAGTLDYPVPLGNSGDGVHLGAGASSNVFGRINGSSVEDNVIAYNLGNGIGVEPAALLGNTWPINTIFENGLLGIDLNCDGVTPNDPLDADSGPNSQQNFPTLTSALTSTYGATSEVHGTIHTTPNTPVTVYFYSSPAADPSGYGEGRQMFAWYNATTDASGNAPVHYGDLGLVAGQVVTATATTANGTSEFSQAIVVTLYPTVQFSQTSYSVDESAGTATITVTRTGGLSSGSTVDYTTGNNTATAGSDYTTTSGTITFLPNQSSATFTVPIANDTLDETNEIVNLQLSNQTLSLNGNFNAQLTIVDDDVAPTANLAITKSASTAAFRPGQPITYTITVSNSGPDAATGVTVTDQLPAGATFVSANGTGAACSGTSTVTCTIPTLTSGTSAVITINVTANGSSSITNSATVAAIETDPVPSNNTGTAAVAPAPEAIPTLSIWMLLLLAAALTLVALRKF